MSGSTSSTDNIISFEYFARGHEKNETLSADTIRPQMVSSNDLIGSGLKVASAVAGSERYITGDGTMSDELKRRVDRLEEEVTNLRSEIREFRSEIKSEIKDLKDDLKKVISSVSDLAKDLAFIKGKVDNLPSTWQMVTSILGSVIGVCALFGVAIWQVVSALK